MSDWKKTYIIDVADLVEDISKNNKGLLVSLIEYLYIMYGMELLKRIRTFILDAYR